MQPRPMADTVSPLLPKVRVCMMDPFSWKALSWESAMVWVPGTRLV